MKEIGFVVFTGVQSSRYKSNFSKGIIKEKKRMSL